MKDRLLKNYITTGLGCLILVGAIAGFIWGDPEKFNETTLGLIAGYGLMFLRSKDSLIGLGPK